MIQNDIEKRSYKTLIVMTYMIDIITDTLFIVISKKALATPFNEYKTIICNLRI
ncbi:hypothetical protein RhiirA4_464959 [Rhizophagus irregularis]|uniref:Uncharacterized protein n=1 Tax=Rhizophagus irregularis TaxID=588596 RepID=A0A2I1GR40_9GLOM|nr:hypothetical protein RhiirA4_464959 [Rhizophagus irregularis]